MRIWKFQCVYTDVRGLRLYTHFQMDKKWNCSLTFSLEEMKPKYKNSDWSWIVLEQYFISNLKYSYKKQIKNLIIYIKHYTFRIEKDIILSKYISKTEYHKICPICLKLSTRIEIVKVYI